MLFKLFVILAVAFTALAAVTPGITLDERSVTRGSLRGETTFYGGNVQGGMCSFSTYSLPRDLHGVALSDSNWNNGANCGGCVQVNYRGKSVTAMVSSALAKEKDIC